MADLPEVRVKTSPPFIDCFCPFVVKEERKKLKDMDCCLLAYAQEQYISRPLTNFYKLYEAFMNALYEL